MELYYNISYTNLDDDNLVNINNKINIISNTILDNSYTTFIEKNNNVQYKNNNFIKKANFYIKKNINSKLYNNECLICFDSIILHNCNKFECNHLLCKDCYLKWNTYCPLCRK